jgi:predicted dienelactone hydrolase
MFVTEKNQKMKLLTTLIFSTLILSCFAQFSVGHTTITFNDPARSGGFGSGGGAGRQIQTEIYYPAATVGDNVPLATGTFPVIVFGHGFAMAWDAYQNIWQRYAAQGYVLAFPRTEGGLIPGPSHGDFGLDLSLVSQRMLALNTTSGSLFQGKLNGNAGIMGHSMGGGASMLAANGNTNIRTVIGLAPAETTPSAISAAAGVNVPSLIFSGSADGVTPPDVHHIPIFDALGSDCKTFVSITGGAHCYFANSNFNCDFGETTSSFGISISRAEQQTITYTLLDLWLDYTLRDDCASYDQFIELSGGGNGFTAETTCIANPLPVINANGSLLSSSATGTAYQWYLNGNLISGANGAQYNATANGAYTVVVTHENGCTTESAPFQLNALTLEETVAFTPVLSPVPTNGQMTIGNTKGIVKYVLVTDLSGKPQPFVLNEDMLDISNCSDGVYIIQINGSTFKVIKQGK